MFIQALHKEGKKAGAAGSKALQWYSEGKESCARKTLCLFPVESERYIYPDNNEEGLKAGVRVT